MRIPFQAREVYLYGIQPVTLIMNSDLTVSPGWENWFSLVSGSCLCSCFWFLFMFLFLVLVYVLVSGSCFWFLFMFLFLVLVSGSCLCSFHSMTIQWLLAKCLAKSKRKEYIKNMTSQRGWRIKDTIGKSHIICLKNLCKKSGEGLLKFRKFYF